MTIGFDGSRAFSKDRTGTENYSYQLLWHLSQLDKENNYIIYLRPGAVVKIEDWPSNFQFSIINFQFLFTQIGLAIRTFINPIDILFVPAHTLPLIRRPGLKTVMTVHDLGAEYLPGMHQLKQRLYLKFITHLQLKSATKLIAVSKATKEDLIKKIQVPRNKIQTIYEGVNTHLKKTNSDTLNRVLKYYEIEKNSYFMFVGTIQPRKNLDRLIRAFASLRTDTSNPCLVLAGSKGWLSDDIYDLPAKLGISDSVKFLGRVPDQDLAALYQAAKALVFPSLFEGFGLPILEAFANDCPVLTSNISSMPEVAGQAAVYVDPYSVADIAKGMKKIQDPKVHDKLIKAGQEQLKKFSWEKAARETLELLEGLS